MPDLEFKIAKPETGTIRNLKSITKSGKKILSYVIEDARH
jgi:hypothetical protein